MTKYGWFTRITGVILILAGMCLVILTFTFINSILKSDHEWFISRFGPEGYEPYRNYDILFEQAKIMSKQTIKYIRLFSVKKSKYL